MAALANSCTISLIIMASALDLTHPEKKKMHVLLLDRAAAPNSTKSPALRIGLDSELQGLVIRLPQVRGGLAFYSKNEQCEAMWQKVPSFGVRQIWFESQL